MPVLFVGYRNMPTRRFRTPCTLSGIVEELEVDRGVPHYTFAKATDAGCT